MKELFLYVKITGQPSKYCPVIFCNRFITLRRKQSGNPKIDQHNHTQDDPVISERFEIMVLDILHQKLDRKDRYAE